MKITLFYLLIIFEIILGQNEKIMLNFVDFSRIPYGDLYFTIVDKSGNPVSLSKNDIYNFIVEQNNKTVKITDIQSVYDLREKNESELYIALAFDNSSSMSGRIKYLEMAAHSFIDSMRPGDYAALFDFGFDNFKISVTKDLQLNARQLTLFSSSKKHLKKYISFPQLTARTFLYDAVFLSLIQLTTQDVLGRKVVILFSDGMDNGSSATEENVIKLAKELDIPIYAIDLNTRPNPKLERIALETNGVYFFVKDPEELSGLYQKINKLIQSQYRLTYNPEELVTEIENASISLTYNSTKTLKVRKDFSIDKERTNYYNLLYKEKTGEESVNSYLNYLSNFSTSKNAENVKLLLGKYWKRRGDYAHSLAVFNMILRDPLSPVYAMALKEKGDFFTTQNRFSEAQLVYNQMLKSELETELKTQTMFNLANTYVAEGNYVMAINTYQSIIKNFEGTDAASDALLQAGILSMQIGNITNAEENFRELIKNYPESDVSNFATIELAKIEQGKGNLNNSIQLLNDLLQSKLDPKLSEEIQLQLAELYTINNQTPFSIPLLSGLINSSTDIIKEKAIQMYFKNLFAVGNYLSAVSFFKTLSPSEQNYFVQKLGLIPIQIFNNRGMGFINGAFVLSPLVNNHEFSFEKESDLKSKFNVSGEVYDILFNSPTKVFLPYEGVKENVEQAGIYKYDNSNWIPVEAEYSNELNGFYFTSDKPLIYALLEKPPQVVRLFNIYFDYNKATIKKEAEVNLYVMVDELKERPDVFLEIAGHTDSIGTEEDNLKLSLERANAVRDFLIINGIRKERLLTKGYGELYPLVPNNSEPNMQMNRRTEFIFINSTGEQLYKEEEKFARFYFIINKFQNRKLANDEKIFYVNRGFQCDVINDPINPQSGYLLILGFFPSEQMAHGEGARFNSIFKGIELELRKL